MKCQGSIHAGYLDSLVRLDRDRIAHGGLKAVMPQQIGQGADVAGILLQKQVGKGVAQ